MMLRRMLPRVLAALVLWIGLAMGPGAWAQSARAADYTVEFWAHPQDLNFPHAFYVARRPASNGVPAVEVNYGFTAKSVTYAILWKSVPGAVESVGPAYLKRSTRIFTTRTDEAGFAALEALRKRWASGPDSIYNLNRHNCVHFIAEAARAVGLKADLPANLVKRPEAFLRHVLAQNPDRAQASSSTSQ